MGAGARRTYFSLVEPSRRYSLWPKGGHSVNERYQIFQARCNRFSRIGQPSNQLNNLATTATWHFDDSCFGRDFYAKLWNRISR